MSEKGDHSGQQVKQLSRWVTSLRSKNYGIKVENHKTEKYQIK